MKHYLPLFQLTMCRIVIFILIITGWDPVLYSQSINSMIDSVFLEWGEQDHPGGALAIVDDGQVVMSRGYGCASLEYGVPITENTLFNIASVSKQVTAFSMILLEQKGLLSLDDNVQKYIPELPDFGEVITIRHLANHTSGLRNFQNLLTMAGWREGDAMRNEDLLKYIKWQNELNFPVGSEYLYCNTGYNLMATIVERVTGNSFIEWTKENIFMPLGMENTRYRNDMTEVVKNTATSYDGNTGGPFTVPRPFWDYMGNGNIYTTVGDMAKWMINFSTHQIGGGEGFEKLTQRGVLTNGDTIRYALGIGVGNYRGHDIVQHGGSIGGYRSQLVYFPGLQTGFVILANYSGAGPGRKIWEVADVFLSEVLGPQPIEEKSNTPGFPIEATELESDQLEKCVGKFDMDDFVVDFNVDNGILYATVSGSPPLPMRPTSDSSFHLPATGYHIFFEKEDDGLYHQITAFAPDRVAGFRIFERYSDLGFLAEFIGDYYSPELKTTYSIRIDDGQLVMEHPRHETFELTPVSETRLKGGVWFFNDIEVERNGVGQVSGLRVSNGRVRNLLLIKNGL